MRKIVILAALLAMLTGCTTRTESPPFFSELAPIDPDHVPGDAAPVPVKRVPAEYPFKFIGKVSGKAEVECLIEKDGTIQRARVKSQTDPAFGDAAVAAIKKWRFKPGLKSGVPVKCAWLQPFIFDANSE